MKLLKTITDKDVYTESPTTVMPADFKERRAARAIVFDENKNIALLHVTKDAYYKLPGGGLEGEEDIHEALARECIEEIGCNIKVIGEVGEILEYRPENKLKQTSYCYIADLVGPKGEPHYEQGELDAGFQPIWVSLDEAISLLKNCKPTFESSYFIIKRDLYFLEEVKKNL